MATLKIKSNLPAVADVLTKQLEILKDREYLLRPVATEIIPMMTERIHKEGKASDGSQIGTYNNAYLRRRENNFNRSNDTKIIVSLTRQLENDWSVIATPNGYAIGFLNAFNYQKARWVEENKVKTIFDLSKEENEYALERINELIADAFAQ